MNINYILSDTTKGATSAALSEVVARSEKEPYSNFIVIVPETKSIIVEKELLAKSKSGAFLNVSVYSFVRLLNRIGKVDASKILNKQTCIVILRRIITEQSANLACYKKVSETIGFAEKLYETIQQLKSSQISPNDLANLEDIEETLKLKLKDIALVYAEYEKFLSQGYLDDCDKLNLLGEVISGSGELLNSNVYVVGFDNITNEMEKVLKVFAMNFKSITFSCVFFGKTKLENYIFKNELFDKFKRIAEAFKYRYVPKTAPAVFKGDFYRIANNLFDVQNGYDSDGSVSIFEAKTEEEEVRYVANQIIELVRGGKRYKDIGVLSCNLESAGNLIKSVFDDYSIPYFVNETYTISEHFFANFVKSVIQIFSTHLDSRSVIEFFSSPVVAAKNFGELSNFVQELGIDHGDFLSFDLEKNAELVKSYENLQENLQILRKFYNKFEKNFAGKNSVSNFAETLGEVFSYFDVQNRLDEISKFQKENNFVVEAEVTGQILTKVTHFGDLLKNFLGEKVVTADEFLSLYLTGLDVIKINLSPVAVDCVVVQSNTDGFYGLDTMFLMGATENAFPCKLCDTGIILDRELEQISGKLSNAVEPTVKQINRREHFRAYECLLEPKSRLFVSYSLKSSDGSSNTKASLVDNLNELFKKKITTTEYVPTKFVNFKVQEKKFASHVEQYLQGEYTFENLNAEYNAIESKLNPEFKNFLSEINYSKPEFKIDPTGLYFYNGKTSISQLENYFKCPYKFFANYGLKIRKRNDYKLNFMDIGNIIHKLAELFMDDIQSFENLSKEDFDKKVTTLLHQALEDCNINASANKTVIQSLENEAKMVCEGLFAEQQASGFKNDKNLNEFEFKGKNGITLKLEDGKIITLEGKIDRIDRFNNYIRIVDYKTGKVDCTLSPIYFGEKIQLVSYLAAIENIEGKNGEKCKVAGLFYLPIHADFAESEKKTKAKYKMVGILLDNIDVVKNMDYNLSFENNESNFVPIKIQSNEDVRRENIFAFSGKNKTTLSEGEIEMVKNYTKQLCLGAVKEILEGYIEPSPLMIGKNDKIPCSYCEFNGFCGKENARFPRGRMCCGDIGIENFKQEEQDGQK